MSEVIKSVSFQTVLIETTIEGTCPLLQSRFTDQSELELDQATRPALTQVPERRRIAEQASYRDDKSRFYHPGTAIARLLREAGGNHKLKGSRKTAKWVVPSAVVVETDQMLLVDPEDGKLIKDFEVDSRSVVNQKTKGRIMSHRPRFDRWGLTLRMSLTTSLLPEAFVQQILQEGGQQLGIGAFRPEKGGPFGRFRVTGWKRITPG